MSIETKILFGVTMSPAMGSEKMTSLWFDEVEAKVRLEYPELNATMLACKTLITTLEVSQATKEAAVTLTDETSEAIITGAGALVGIVTYPANVAAEGTAVAAVDSSVDQIDSCTEDIHKEIDKIIPNYLPNEEN